MTDMFSCRPPSITASSTFFALTRSLAAPNAVAVEPKTVAETPAVNQTLAGEFIPWRQHRIDDQDINGGVAIRSGYGIAIGDIDGDGLEDLVTAH